jgi:putative tryptophan/tyrosine transport system substrate-binding protein
MPVVGLLNVYWPLGEAGRGPFALGLNQGGFVEGQNVVIERRWAEGHYDRLPALAADLVARKVDVIVALNGTPPALAAKSATSTIPIVFASVGDPVGIGLVASLARPGGNITGFTNITTELMPKLVELLTELAPQAGVIAGAGQPEQPECRGRHPKHAGSRTRKRGAACRPECRPEREIGTAFASLVEVTAGGVVVDPDGFLNSRRSQIVALAARYTVPAIYPHPQYVTAGGLMSYGIDDDPVYHQAGIYAAKILKGAKPADLPVQQPTKFELVVNLKTAKALGLTVPPAILARADEVIE